MKAAILFALAVMAVAQTPAERRITAARRAIEKDPGSYQLHNELALALTRRARETSDPSLYDEAEKVLAASFRLAPDNYEGLKIRTWAQLGRHQFAEALALAEKLNRRMPDDVLVYGFLTDANNELGNYEAAEKAAQWMLNLRPGNVPGLTRGAYLRELWGDLEGARDFMLQAYQRTDPGEKEDRAWILTQAAHLELTAGAVAEAETLLDRALSLFPGYHYALANLAKVRQAQGRHQEAAELLDRRYRAAPHPENLYDLAAALEKAGKAGEAAEAWKRFERQALAESALADNANRELALYYADYARNPEAALRTARLEMARRHDIHTLDVYAWALFRNGRRAEAAAAIERAVAPGTRDPQIRAHAAAIRSALVATAR
jgi:tetratricopeptide (TPR) repeat protein